MGAGDPVVAFSAFVTNQADPLAQFSDAVFHADCFHAHPLAEKATRADEWVRSRLSPEHRRCDICGGPILAPDDHFATGLLTSAEQDPLARYNALQAHRACLAEWVELGDFYDLLKSCKRSGRCRGPGVDVLLDQLGALPAETTEPIR